METIEEAVVEVRIGRRLEPAMDGRRGTLAGAGKVDREWLAWLPHLKPAKMVPDDVDGEVVWIYAADAGAGPKEWKLVWFVGLEALQRAPSPERPADGSPLTALDDLEAVRRRRGEAEVLDKQLGLLEVRRAHEEARLAFVQQQNQSAREELTELRAGLIAERKRVDDEIAKLMATRQGLANTLAAEIKELTESHAAQRKELTESHAAQRKQIVDETTVFRRSLEQQRKEFLAETTSISGKLTEHAKAMLEFETLNVENAAARSTHAYSQLQNQLEMNEELAKNKALAIRAGAPRSGWDLIGDAAAKQIEQGALKDVGKGLADLIKIIRGSGN